MNEKNRNLVVRIVSALLLLPAVLWLLWLGGFAAAGLVAFAAAVVAGEICALVGLRLAHPAAVVAIALSAALPLLATSVEATWPAMLTVLAFAPIASLLLVTLAPPGGELKSAAPLAAWAALCPAYAGLCLSAVVALRELPGGVWWMLVVLAVTWGNDSGAYFAGRALGRHKLMPSVSPSKTWEGFAGGMVASVLACFVIRAAGFEALRVVDCLVIGGVAGVLGPLGDLSESMVKRAHGAKDSGRIMPGHGGLYDRLDALLFNAPWVLAWTFVMPAP